MDRTPRPTERPSTRARSGFWALTSTRKGLAVVLPILLAAGLAYVVADSQGARGQEGIEEYQQDHDRENPTPVMLLRNQLWPGGFNKVYERAVTIDEARASDSDRSLTTMSIDPASASPTDRRSVRSARFTLVGQNYAPVLIDDIRIRTVARRAPIAGSIYWTSPQGGGLDVEEMGFDLDSPDTSARTVSDSRGILTDSYFARSKIALKKDEPVPFLVKVRTGNCDCDYVLDVIYADGKRQTLNDAGSPWRTSSFSRQYQRSYALDVGATRTTVVRCNWPVECRRY